MEHGNHLRKKHSRYNTGVRLLKLENSVLVLEHGNHLKKKHSRYSTGVRFLKLENKVQVITQENMSYRENSPRPRAWKPPENDALQVYRYFEAGKHSSNHEVWRPLPVEVLQVERESGF